MEKRHRLVLVLILLGVLCVIIALVFLFLLSEKKMDSSKENSPNEELLNTICYRCTKEPLQKETYQINYTYQFCFNDDELNYGNYYYSYVFNDLEGYQNFQIPKTEQFNPIEVKEDNSQLIREYIFELSYPTEGRNLNQYVEMLQGWGYTCTKN